jgi:hypothetical protein
MKMENMLLKMYIWRRRAVKKNKSIHVNTGCSTIYGMFVRIQNGKP